jgi:hypothetical protein
MENIFNPHDNQVLVQRLEKLTPQSQACWGKMNVSQMLRHCQKPMEVAEGKLKLKRNLISLLFGKMAKKSMLKQDEFKKNLPTVPAFKSEETPEFDSEWNLLVSLVKKFGEKGPQVLATKKHPFFGEMTEEEWGVLNYKHLDHHLKQFGA